ncbi:4-hydroxy-2-oxovalerate aldolase [Synergistales bacterium]|nr:4-hydroxy-2-oxovalerate aldolase [Synergistales bacterium]
MIIRSTLKKRLLSGETVLGTFVDTDGSDIVEILGNSGFDFVVLDMEHAPGTPQSIMNQLRAAEGRGMDAIARLPNTERTTVLRALDIGVSGALAPQINDFSTAHEFIDATLYPPFGCRGFASTRATGYGLASSIPEYLAEANSDLLRIVQCETETSVLNLNEIATIKEIDMVFVGPYDLSLSLGVPGDFNHPRVTEAIDKILAICKEREKMTGIFVSSPEELKNRIKQGFRFFTYSMDALIFAAAAKNITSVARNVMREMKP